MEKNEEKNFKMEDPTYYSRIVMMIIMAIQLILFIIFAVLTHTNSDNMEKVYQRNDAAYQRNDAANVGCYEVDYYPYYECVFNNINNITKPLNHTFIFKEHEKQMDTCFAFFVISFFFFLIEFIMHFCCATQEFNEGFFKNFFNYWNHLIIILTFVIAQFLYIIACLVTPIYLDRTRSIRDLLYIRNPYTDQVSRDFVEVCIKKYAVCFAISFTFLVIFIFLDFIIINLYKGVCCDMTLICNWTHKCLSSFFICFGDNVFYWMNKCQRKDNEINKLEEEVNDQEKTIAAITCQIQNTMKENIKLRVDKINYL